MAMAAGVSTVEVPASGGNGGTDASDGRPSCSDDGHSTLSISVAPAKATTTTIMPAMMVRRFIAKAAKLAARLGLTTLLKTRHTRPCPAMPAD